MARPLNKLSDSTCKASLRPGLHGDGGGLYLHVKPSGAKSWTLIWKRAGRRYEMGLGGYPAIRLAKARLLAAEYRQHIAEGRNPISERRKIAEPTFGECADRFLESMESQWRNSKHRAQWRMTLEKYAAPIRELKVSEVGTDDVLRVLNPLWRTRPETASRLRGRIERVLDYAKVNGWRSGENPALWRGHLRSILPARQRLTRGHHAAMPYPDIPRFMEALRVLDAVSARALEFLVLTAARSGEVLGARWDEFDFDERVWTVPAIRMKSGREHRVPMSASALAIVSGLRELRVSDYVFPGQKPNKPLSSMSMAMLLRRMKLDRYTPHGFRSSFRDWAGDTTAFPRDVAEQALAHQVGDATERAYRRADVLEKRRELMMVWANYCGSAPCGNVVSMVRTA